MHSEKDLTITIWHWSATIFPRMLTAAITLIIGYMLAVWITRIVRRVLAQTARVDPTIQPAITSSIHYAVIIIAIVAALGDLGVQTASLIAVLGAAGIAIALALQGTLTNIAAGIMLLWLRPFHVGDYIEAPTNNISGTVKEIGLFACALENADGIFVFAPNGAVWNTALRNYSRNSGRLISLSVSLPVSISADKAREVLGQMLDSIPCVLKDPAPVVFVDTYDSTKGVVLTCSFRISQGHAAEVQRVVIDEAKRRLDQLGMGENTQIVRRAPADTDPTRLLIGNTALERY
jgi:small conductance mechanosensitive channel